MKDIYKREANQRGRGHPIGGIPIGIRDGLKPLIRKVEEHVVVVNVDGCVNMASLYFNPEFKIEEIILSVLDLPDDLNDHIPIILAGDRNSRSDNFSMKEKELIAYKNEQGLKLMIQKK